MLPRDTIRRDRVAGAVRRATDCHRPRRVRDLPNEPCQSPLQAGRGKSPGPKYFDFGSGIKPSHKDSTAIPPTQPAGWGAGWT